MQQSLGGREKEGMGYKTQAEVGIHLSESQNISFSKDPRAGWVRTDINKNVGVWYVKSVYSSGFYFNHEFRGKVIFWEGGDGTLTVWLV